MYGGFEFLTLNNNFSLDKSWIFGLKVSEKPFQYRLIGLMGNVIPTCINATLVNKSREDLLEIFRIAHLIRLMKNVIPTCMKATLQNIRSEREPK
ncbi:hypothetical protein GE061_015695 [Apolygus lucorum]|uniref:Uncharacterized protein n=1 Tax=Apolygus lucorum TaxID=248454 RepID=A0A6A4JMF7_APOLU|nr:hypothetical protein GE061_015695 [Apolygus lucorum]